MEISEPIVIVCAGRSGSTLVYRLLARHGDLGWLSTYNQVLPSQTWVSVFSRLYGAALFDRVEHAYWFPKPFSAYRFWARYLPDVARHDRPLTAEDVRDESIEPLRRAIGRVLRHQGKPRFLTKVTGWARMAYFDRVFPDARFLYLERTPASVVASWLKAGWLNVTPDVRSAEWEWGRVPDAYLEIYDELGGGPELSAAVKTQLDVDDILRNVAWFPERTFHLSYEDFVRDPREHLRRTLDFCGLDWDERFERAVRSTPIRDYTDKWRKQIPPAQVDKVEAFFERVAALGANAAARRAPAGASSLSEA